jgi:hypothetical protein
MQLSRDMLIRIGGGLAIVLVLYFLLKSSGGSSSKSDDYGGYARFERYAPYSDDQEEEGDDMPEAEYMPDIPEMSDDEMPADEDEDYVPEDEEYVPEEAEETEGMGYGHSGYQEAMGYEHEGMGHMGYEHEGMAHMEHEGMAHMEHEGYEHEGMENMSYDETSYEEPQEMAYDLQDQEEEVGEDPEYSDATMLYDEATPVEGFNAYDGNYEEFTVMESTLDDSRANGMFATPI